MKLKLFFHPIVLFRYTIFGIYRELNYVKYLIRKKRNISIHYNTINKIKKYVDREFNEDIFSLFKNSNMIFLDESINGVIDSIKADLKYSEKIIEEANEILNNSVNVLNNKFVSFFDTKAEHYKWGIDFLSNHEFLWAHYTRVRKLNNRDGVDIKNVWELARMQYLFTLGVAYRLTNDDKYAYKIINIIADFINVNEFQEGPNWNVSMEVGIRVANMVLAIELIENSNAINEHFIEEFVASCYEHMMHIWHNQENHGLTTSNHHIGGLLGLLTVSAKFKFLPNSKQIFKYSKKSMEEEIRLQVLNDGGHYEGSTSYHRLVGEMFCFAALICENINRMSDGYYEILYKMQEFTRTLMKTNGLVPQIGDNDSSRVFKALCNNPNDHRSFVNLASRLVTKENVQEYVNLYDCFDIFRSNYQIKNKVSRNILPRNDVVFYKDSGIIIYRDDIIYLAFYAVDASRFGLGGHTHCDLCSFELSILGCDFIIDLGTGYYTANKNIRNILRSTKSHATAEIAGNDQKKIGMDLFNFDSYPDKIELNIIENSQRKLLIRGYHNGYEKKYCIKNTRHIEILKEQHIINILDKFEGNTNYFKRIYFPLQPDVKFYNTDEGVRLINKQYSLNLYTDSKISVLDTYYSSGYGLIEETKCIMIETLSEEAAVKIKVDL